jgi:hypothetical protein
LMGFGAWIILNVVVAFIWQSLSHQSLQISDIIGVLLISTFLVAMLCLVVGAKFTTSVCEFRARTTLPGVIPDRWRTVIREANTFFDLPVVLIFEANWQIHDVLDTRLRNDDPLICVCSPMGWYLLAAFEATDPEFALSIA